MTEQLEIRFVPLTAPLAPVAVLLVGADRELSPLGKRLDRQTDGALERAVAAADFKGKARSSIEILGAPGIDPKRVIIVGSGDPDAPELDLILRFSGGHSAYSGTAPQVYDVRADRYSLPLAPEYPVEYVYSNDQVRGEWSFKGNPWMTGHTYKSTGYDPNLKALVFASHDFTYFFDPQKSKWSRSRERNPYQANFYVVTVCATPHGAVVWANHRQGGASGLWRLNAETDLHAAQDVLGEAGERR